MCSKYKTEEGFIEICCAIVKLKGIRKYIKIKDKKLYIILLEIKSGDRYGLEYLKIKIVQFDTVSNGVLNSTL